jgi:hypothetical protein
MTNASVIVDIDATNLMNNINFSFRGNYTISNPSEEMNVTIATPFSRMDIGPNSLCNIKLNGSIIPYNIIDFDYSGSDLWDAYFDYLSYDLMLLICDITIPENTSIILEYAFDAKLTTNLNNLHELWIFYIVGTSRAWEGKITESVEFKVHGKTPDEFYNHSCKLLEQSNGTSYLWEWENEIIYDDAVFIIYYGNYSSDPFIPLFGSLVSTFLICAIIIIGIVGFVYLMTRDKNLVR